MAITKCRDCGMYAIFTLCGECAGKRTVQNNEMLRSSLIMDGQELKEGTKKDEGKNRLDLLPFDALEEIGKVLTAGSKKYDARNWEKGINYSRVFGAAMRHGWAWFMASLRGQTSLDEETGLNHLAHMACCVLFLLSYEIRGMKDFDDRPEVGNVKSS